MEKPKITIGEFASFLGSYTPGSGIVCRSHECAFYALGGVCGLKTTMIVDGQCQQYNNEIKQEDLCPRAFAVKSPEGQDQ